MPGTGKLQKVKKRACCPELRRFGDKLLIPSELQVRLSYVSLFPVEGLFSLALLEALLHNGTFEDGWPLETYIVSMRLRREVSIDR